MGSGESLLVLNRAILEINSNDAFLSKLYPLYGQSYNVKPIKVYIDTYGGEVRPTFGLISIMNTSKTPIHTVVTGSAMSAGFIILINGHKRFAYSMSRMMYHQLSSGTYGKLKDMAEDVEEKKEVQLAIESNVIKKTNITQRTLLDAYEKKKDIYYSAESALRNGIIDEIIS